MAVDQDRMAESDVGLGQKPPKRGMIGLVDIFYPGQGLADRQAVPIDLLGLADDAGDRAQATGHPDGADVGIRRQAAVEHLGVELIRLAVHIQISAGEVGLQKGGAHSDDVHEQLIDIGVFGTADREFVQTGRIEETCRILTAGMRGIEDERQALVGRGQNFKGRQTVEVGLRRIRGFAVACVWQMSSSFRCSLYGAKESTYSPQKPAQNSWRTVSPYLYAHFGL